MKKAFILSVLLGLAFSTVHAQSETYKKVDSTLYAYYRWCNNNIRDSLVLLKADTLFRLSAEKHDTRMQAVSLSFKADHYYFNNNLDSLKAWIPRVQEFARKTDQLKYYYFTWGRLILYYTKHTQYTLAQYELERYMEQAEKDDYKPAIAEAYKQLGHIYRTRGLKNVAAEYYGKAIDFIIRNDLDRFSLSNLYSEMASMLIDDQRYAEAAAAIEKGKACIPLPEYIWSLKLKETLLLAKTGHIDEAKTLFREVRKGHGGYLTETSLRETQLAVYNRSHEYGKAMAAIDTLIELFVEAGYKESYFATLYANRAEINAATGKFEAAYRDLLHYIDVYRQKASADNEKTLGEFATLLDVSRLDKEKAELEQQAQAERLHRMQLGTIGLGIILLLAAVFIGFMALMNRRLARAKRAAEEGSRMKGIFIRNITHEINTPLNAIVGFAELAAAADSPDPAERQSYINIIQENSGYLQKLVDDVLYIAGLESSDTPPAMGPTDINACCLQCIKNVTFSYSRQIDIRFLPAQEKFQVHTSCLLLSKAITELLRNAVRFAADGQITLAYTLSEQNRQIVFSVTDTGPGVPASEAGHIFERFVKLDPFSQGMGLGLAVCRLIASALGGKAELDTTYTAGARFTLTIPLR